MDQFTAHLDRGWDLVQRGDFAGAMLSAHKGLELDADSPEAHNLVGYIHAAEGNPEDALEAYQRAIDLDESFVEAMLNATEILIHPMHDYESALRMVEEAMDYLEDDQEKADATLLKVDVLLAKGDRDAASRAVQTLPQGPFENPTLEFLTGRAMFEIGDLAGAHERLGRSVELDAHNAEAYYYLGMTHEARGSTHEATVSFLRSREVDLRTPPLPWSLSTEQFEKLVRKAIERLPAALQTVLDGALVMLDRLPGIEVVADGVDPRVPLLFDDIREKDGTTNVRRVFVYQQNVERNVPSVLAIEDELAQVLELELTAMLAQITKPDASPDAGAPATKP